MAASFRVAVIRQVVNALRKTFDNDYPDTSLRNLYIGPDFQYERSKYPAIIIRFEPTTVRNLGMGHYVVDTDNQGFDRIYHQWYFEGSIAFTVWALSSYQRDVLLDNIMDVIAFGRYKTNTSAFYNEIYDDDFITLNMQTEDIRPGTNSTSEVPWQAENEQFYTGSWWTQVTGHFYSDGTTGALVPIRQINAYPYREDQAVPQGAEPPWN